MQNSCNELSYSPRDWNNYRKWILSVGLKADPTIGEEARFKSKSLIFFSGISLGKFDVSNDLRSPLTWKNYGKLSLKDSEIVGYKEKGINLAKTVAKTTIAYFVPSWIIQFSNDMYGALQDHLAKQRCSCLNWDLKFNEKTTDQGLVGLVAGECSYEAAKHGAGSILGKKVIQRFEELSDFDIVRTQDELPFNILNCPFIYVSTEYVLQESAVKEVLSRVPKKISKRYPNHTLIHRLNMDIEHLSPDGSNRENYIYAYTFFEQDGSYDDGLITLSGPVWPREERVYGKNVFSSKENLKKRWVDEKILESYCIE